MNFTKYDYYGNYNNKEDELNIFNVQDIHKKQKEKENSRINIYKSITSRCFKKIKETSLNEETFCFFNIPEYIPGLPLYNMTECVMFILNILREKGFNARYCDKYVIYISWNLPKPNLKLLESPSCIEKKNVVDELNLKYKPIENYSALGKFIPRKKF
jgi:hypothetical protein